jgi:hypothetical protein
MKYARSSWLSVMTLTIVSIGGSDLRAQSGSRVYRYSRCDCAYELPDQIRIGSKLMPIQFDEHSDEQALKSFRSLNYSVFLGVYDRLYVIGAYDAAKSKFRLDRWYAIVPFTEYLAKDHSVLSGEVYKKKRSNLRRTDFKRTADFDPASPEFNPLIYQRKRERVRQKRAASNKALQLTAR